ncbi:MAG: hypothetical protein L6R40_005335 [Gallowayella cf. fulva]|nr:MAG: hypothetical protein L6R40_005335 [Xanthomendoza cf. fulva]
MADPEEDFSSLPLPDRFSHKNWKVRKQGYEDAAKTFEATPDESDPAFRPFLQDSGLWKGAVADSNVAAQQDGINALCAFLKYGGQQACTRSRSVTIAPIVEKGLASTRAATKQSALEALLLYIELDKSDPIIDDLLPSLNNKQPKLIAATLSALTAIFHAYGIKIVDPKPVLKALPKVFGHADKNVRAEAQNLAVELYRWLREAMKTLFWSELKPVQQQDLEKLFEAVKQEPLPKQERLLRSQQAAVEAASLSGPQGAEAEDEVEEEQPAEVDAFDLAEPVDVLSKVPGNFHESMASSKWKDRKDALDALFVAVNTDRIKDGPFDEIVTVLAKSMKDANIAVVTVAANCIECLAKGLRHGFAKYRSRTMPAIMERLKEKKQSVADALGAALDAVFASTGLSECLEDILEFLKNKNPQVKSETLKFLIRCLKTTREAPSKPEVKLIAEAATKLLAESVEATRSAGAEALGTLMKIMGERAMGPYMEGLDDIKKAKIKDFCEAAEVKAKDKPKPVAPPPPKAAPPGQKKVGTKKPTLGAKKPAPRPATPQEEPAPPPPKTATKSVASKISAPKALVPPQKTGLQGPKKISGPGTAAPSSTQSPRRNINLQEEDNAPIPSKLSRGLAGRPLARPTDLSASTSEAAPAPAPAPQALSITPAERLELNDLRSEKEYLIRTNEDLRASSSRLQSQIHELQNQNAQLIEDHTRDVLSIKAKETQLVRARSDAESAEGQCQRLGRELDRLKREMKRIDTERSPADDGGGSIYRDRGRNGSESSRNVSGTSERLPSADATSQQQQQQQQRGNSSTSLADSRETGYQRMARNYAVSPSEEKENENDGGDGAGGEGEKMGRSRSPVKVSSSLAAGPPKTTTATTGRREVSGEGESWKRAAEVTSQLKARIEMMKAKQGLTKR